MNKDIAKGKVKQAKGNIKEKVGKVTGDKSQLEIPKICPSCHNPRWDKTARNTQAMAKLVNEPTDCRIFS